MKLDLRTIELVAIGAAVTANCHPCIEFHTAKAAKLGIDDQEVQEAIEVGRQVRKGAASRFDQYAEQLTGGERATVSSRCGDTCS